MNLDSLKARNLKNKPRETWAKGGFTVYHLHNGYWLSCFEFREQFNTIREVKERIKKYFKN